MSHRTRGTTKPLAKTRPSRTLAPLALCLVSIPVLAKSTESNPLEYPAIRPRAAHAELIGEVKASPRRRVATTASAPLPPKPWRAEPEKTEPSWLWLDATPGDNAVLLRTPAATRAKSSSARVTVMLHGMCDVPQNECPSFASATSSDWLVCPQASLGCNGGGATWSWKDRVTRVEGATRRALDGRNVAPSAPRTLIGFSLGATTALDVAQNGREHYDALVLIAGRVYPDASKLKAHGVRRVVLAAGDFDGSAAHLRTEARRLDRAGVETRFMSLGKVGHQFAQDMPRWLDEALTWAEQRGPGVPGAVVPTEPR